VESRRDFLKKATLLASGMMVGSVPESIRKALVIDPEPGSTFLDAEYVVILMQENRAFDHAYGCLQGVRGFNEPHPLELPDGNPVWLQSDEHGRTYPPFRLNMWESRATWMDSLPHGWNNQTDARNGGRYDKWLPNKHSSTPEYHDMPLTMGYYNRTDIPFYYALADAFTVCDANHCSSLTGTNPNRLHLWTGTVRAKQETSAKACILNEDVGYPIWVSWPTFPERLEAHGVSWKIYQNELDLGTGGLSDDENNWLGNFQDNPTEWFEQFGTPFRSTRQTFVAAQLDSLPKEIEALKQRLASAAPAEQAELKKTIADREGDLALYRSESGKYSKEKWDSLDALSKNIHQKAFVTNDADPNFRKLVDLAYEDNGVSRTVKVPAGDVFHQFREDVNNGHLPMVSWLVAPEAYSDHPSSAWYGAWYVSEALDILTKNPEVWKKTIFILCYDENDGYFDHVPPYVAPNPKKAETGKTTGIDTSVDFVELAEDLKHHSAEEARESSIGLGFRVPLVVASPWSRGGMVNSETFDHTSILQFLEVFVSHKTGRPLHESNISDWRRTVCGDLTSVFRPYHGEAIELPKFLDRDEFVEDVHKAKFKKLPDNFVSLSSAQIDEIKKNPRGCGLMPKQESGTRAASPLKYELYADGAVRDGGFSFTLSAGQRVFGKGSLSSGFNVYAYTGKDVLHRSYAVTAGSDLHDVFPLELFEGGTYRVRVDGPNGFYREFRGLVSEPLIETHVEYVRRGSRLSGDAKVTVRNVSAGTVVVQIKDEAYGGQYAARSLTKGESTSIEVKSSQSHGWYDFSLSLQGVAGFAKRYAGHVETGVVSVTDPAMA
jgi:phospholipase C